MPDGSDPDAIERKSDAVAYHLANALIYLRRQRDRLGHSDQARTIAIAITELENAMLRLGYPIEATPDE